MFDQVKRILALRKKSGSVDDDGPVNYLRREKIIVFAISFILAFCLWFIVNLSRDHSITLSLPIEIGNMPDNLSLSEEIPDHASVTIAGEGWQLISLYNNPPTITVDALEQEINLYEKIQQQMMGMPEININNVQPSGITLQLEQKATRRVPVELNSSIELGDRFEMLAEPVLSPDSVTISGAASNLAVIDRVETFPVERTGVSENLELTLDLVEPAPGITINPPMVGFRLDVAEFTEGEARIPISIRNLPPGREVTYNPSIITVRYSVPIDQYSDVQEGRPFQAYVEYETIETDTTGVVIPQIEATTDEYDVRLRSFQPGTVSYFNVIQDN